jgi:hypothetical protein
MGGSCVKTPNQNPARRISFFDPWRFERNLDFSPAGSLTSTSVPRRQKNVLFPKEAVAFLHSIGGYRPSGKKITKRERFRPQTAGGAVLG